MTISRADFPLLKWGIYIFLAALFLAITAVVASGNFVAQARQGYLDAGHKQSAAQSRLDHDLQDAQDRKTYAAEYAELLGHDLIGNDRQPNWADELETFRSRHLVLGFNYVISPQQSLNPSSPLERGNYDLHQSRMSIRLDLLHEGQLLAFLAALHSANSGRFILDHCSIERSRDMPISAAYPYPASTMQRSQSNLHAACTGSWLTMNNRNAQ